MEKGGKRSIMKCGEIMEKIEMKYPRECACDWDNPGLLAGDRGQEVDTVYIALDATDEVIDAAVSCGAQLLLTHHPMIFGGIKAVTTDDYVGKRLIRMIRAGVSCYAMHTNYDVLGMADLAAGILDLSGTEVLEEVRNGEGIGRTGRLPKAMSLREWGQFVKERFRLPNVKIFGDLNKMVTTAAISPGSGKSMAYPALKAGVDVLISGDIDHHTGIDMADCGMAVIDAGHYGIEHIYVEDMRRFLECTIPSLKVSTAPVGQPFEVI